MTHEARQYRRVRIAVSMYGTAVLAVGVALIVLATQQLWALDHAAAIRCSCGTVTSAATSVDWIVTSIVAALGLVLVTGALLNLVRRSVTSHRQVRAWIASGARQSEGFVLVPSEQTFAVTAGIAAPTIFCSTRLRDRLSRDEFQAVLAHERAHVAMHDPWWTMVFATAHAAWYWLPGMRTLVQAGYSLRELHADATATNAYADTASLASAFARLADVTAPAQVVAFSPNGDRAERLLNQHWRYPLRLPIGQLVVGTLVMVLGIGIGAGMVRAATPVVPTRGTCADIQHFCRQTTQTTTTQLCLSSGSCFHLTTPGQSHAEAFSPAQ